MVWIKFENTFSDSSLIVVSLVTAWKVSKYGVILSPIFPHSDWIRKDSEYLSVISPNAGKYGPEKAPYLDTFHAMSSLVTYG